MKKPKRALVLVSAVVLLAGAAVISNLANRPAVYDPGETKGFSQSPAVPEKGELTLDTALAEPQLIGESGNAQLYYNPAVPSVELRSAATGFVWKSDISPESLPGYSQAESLRQLCSAVIINTESDNTGMVNNASTECSLSYSGLKNGLEISFFFPNEQLRFSVQLWVDAGRLWSRIPVEAISENDPFRLLSIDLMPYFGASENTDGYIMMPDGAGAIYRLDGADGRLSSPVNLDVYSDRVTDVDALLENEKNGIHSVSIPAFGIARGNDALCGYIYEGAESASLCLEPNGYIFAMSRVYASSVYRKVTETVSDAGISSFQADSDIRTGSFAVCYEPLSGENADYAGMAASVRGLMEKQGLLTDRETESAALKLDIMMGASESTMLGNRYRAVTTLSQLDEMLSQLPGGGKDTVITLLGWQKRGYGIYPETGRAAGAVGSLPSWQPPDGVRAFLSYGTQLALDGEAGATQRRDAIRSGKNVTVMSADGTYLLNASAQLKLFRSIKKRLFAPENTGLCISGAGSILYDDYNKRCSMTREQTKNCLAALLSEAGETSPLMIDRANAYALPFADWLSALPEESSGYHLLDEEVPFYYLVVSGKIPYSMDIAGNLSADFRITRLRWAEYGAVPYFIVSHDGGGKLSRTKAQIYFSVKFSDELEKIRDTEVEFSALREKLGSTLLDHERLADGVYRSYFEKGSLIVNYNETDYSLDGTVVPALDYITEVGK